MKHLKCSPKPMIYAISIGLLGLSLFISTAQAQIVPTQTLADNAKTDQIRSHIQTTLNREEVKKQLTELGVDPIQIQARVESLTDAEAQELATKIDSLPAGGRADNVTILLIIIIIILLV